MLLLRTTVTALTLCALMVFAPAALAVRYAAPGGTVGDPCTFAAPCTIAQAVGAATPGDKTVRLFGGDYPALPATVATTVGGMDIAAEPGTGRPVIHVPSGMQLRVVNASRIADVDIIAAPGVGDALFMSDSGTLAERLRMSGSASTMVRLGAISLTSTLRDSLIINSSSSASSSGVSQECNGCASVARVSGVTVLTKSGPALKAMADANGSSSATMNVVNTIALATGGGVPDVEANADGGSGTDKAVVNLDHSAWSDALATAPREEVNNLGGRVSAAPLLVDLLGGDLRQAPGSPTIDAGTPSGFEGLLPLDVFGLPRTLGLAVDIGGDETPAAPEASTGAASAVTTTGASVAGVVTPGGTPASWRVEYGTTAAYGSTVAGLPVTGSGFTGEAVNTTLSGLAPATTYHYRLAASHAYGAGVGSDATFTTAAVPGDGGGGSGGGGGTPVAPAPPAVIPPVTKPAALPPLAKGCVSVRDFTIRLKRGVKPTAVTVTIDGKRATVTRGKTVRARINLKGTPKKIVTVKIVVTAKGGKKTTTLRRYKTCSKKAAGRNQVAL